MRIFLIDGSKIFRMGMSALLAEASDLQPDFAPRPQDRGPDDQHGPLAPRADQGSPRPQEAARFSSHQRGA